ncbi:hypothetical protein HDU67_010312 [Dinochytrium kinnereticum]|nr:hypothetical protein HDU67_010312 [Dinochytrium kinnereticum]
MNELQFRLTQKLTLEKTTHRRIICKMSFPGVRPHEAGHKVIRLEIPQCAPTTTTLGNALQITYEAEIVGIMGMAISTVVASAPVVIVAPGRGVLVANRVESEEADLEAVVVEGGAAGKSGLVKSSILGDGSLDLGEKGTSPAVSDALAGSSGSMLTKVGARELTPDVAQTGTVSFQSCNLFYFDLGADLSMKCVEEDHGGEGDEGQEEVVRMPTVIVEAESSVGLRVSLGAPPTWWTYDLREELRTDNMDGSQEHLVRLSRGPGRYFVGVFGNSLAAATGVRYRISLMIASAAEVLPPGPSEGEDGQMRTKAMQKATSPYWAKATGGEIPPDAFVAGSDLDGTLLYVARAPMVGGGIHVGKIGRGFRTAQIPYDGKEKGVVGEYEVLCAIPGARWEKVKGRRSPFPEAAIPAGYEEDGRPLYVGRATVHMGWRSSLVPGKAAPHLFGVNVAFDGKEVNVGNAFEVLVYDDRLLQPFANGGGGAGVKGSMDALLVDELEDYQRVLRSNNQ